ncbi:hypothetical protein GF376_00685 [Candidatus Peregrinibacteria bacterium]|nr:hypothetical protein [Candidatus Peregrinibacteria bacterium]
MNSDTCEREQLDEAIAAEMSQIKALRKDNIFPQNGRFCLDRPNSVYPGASKVEAEYKLHDTRDKDSISMEFIFVLTIPQSADRTRFDAKGSPASAIEGNIYVRQDFHIKCYKEQYIKMGQTHNQMYFDEPNPICLTNTNTAEVITPDMIPVLLSECAQKCRISLSEWEKYGKE